MKNRENVINIYRETEMRKTERDNIIDIEIDNREREMRTDRNKTISEVRIRGKNIDKESKREDKKEKR